MANTQKYLNHLLQNTGITPACSEEERQAADIIANIFSNHGFDPEIQEFSAKGTAKVVQAVLGIVVFVCVFLAGFGGAVSVIGMVLLLLAVVVYEFERMNKPIFSQLGAGGLSQNVIAYHKASGPLASPRNRPVVVVAHYDSPRVDFLCQESFSSYRPLIVKSLPYLMVAPAVILIVRLFPVPTGAKVVLWILALVAAFVPLAYSISIIANRFVLPYTTGSVCNKSSVAALLGVMDEVSPFRGREEFPEDVPFDEYFAEQQRMAEEAALVAEAERLEKEELKRTKQEGLKSRFSFGKGAKEEEPEGDVEDLDEYDALEVEGSDEDALEFVDFDTEFDGTLSSTIATDGLEDLGATLVEGAEPELADEDGDVDGSTTQIDVEELEGNATLSDEALDIVEGLVEAVGETPEEEFKEDLLTEGDMEDVEDSTPAAVAYPFINAEGNVRHGAEVVRSLGMLAPRCTLVYPEDLIVVEEPKEKSEKEAREAAAKKRVEERRKQAEEERAAREAQRASIRKAVAEEYEERLLQEQEEARRLAEDMDASELADEDAALEVAAGMDEAAEDASGDVDETKTAQFFVVDSESEAADVAQAAPRRSIETVDSLMAEIAASHTTQNRVPQRALNIPTTGGGDVQRGSRSTLFDVPDPSSESVDPFSIPVPEVEPDEAPAYEESASQAEELEGAASSQRESIGTISAPKQEKERHGLARLFGKKKKEESMSDWLGVDEDYDAKKSGGEIGSWDNFYDEDDSSWKGGATGPDGVSEEDLVDAITSMGDDELLGHDIWFVATGASENGNAGIDAFLDTHRDRLRGVFLINLECVGAGEVSMVATEGARRVLKGDKRIMKLVSRVSADFHNEYPAVEMSHVATDAYAAMSRSLRSLTIAGVEGTGFACSHTEDDQPYNVDPGNVSMVAEVVTEVIRRS